MFTPPSSVKVGPHDYDVELRAKFKLFGETRHRKTRIIIGPQSPSSERDTMLHEVLHAVIWSSGAQKVLSIDDVYEEQLVRLLTPWLLGVIRENPDLMMYLVAESDAYEVASAS